jgi:hypothetical protein
LMITMGAPFDGLSRDLGKYYAKGSGDRQELVEIAGRHGLKLEGAG